MNPVNNILGDSWSRNNLLHQPVPYTHKREIVNIEKVDWKTVKVTFHNTATGQTGTTMRTINFDFPHSRKYIVWDGEKFEISHGGK